MAAGEIKTYTMAPISARLNEKLRKDIEEYMAEEKLDRSMADAAVFAMAKKRDGTAIPDEDYARSIAGVKGMDNRGTVFLILRLLRQGVMSPGEAKKTVDAMIDHGWYCSLDLYKEIVNTFLDESDRR